MLSEKTFLFYLRRAVDTHIVLHNELFFYIETKLKVIFGDSQPVSPC